MTVMDATVDGLTWHYESFGEGRPVLMLPGWPSTHLLMTVPLEPIFASRRGWRRIYPDLPGMGATPGTDSISDQVGMLQATLRFMDAVGPGERFSVIGTSYGGYLTLGVLHEIAERLDGLMLWGPMLSHPSKTKRPGHTVFRHDPEIDEIIEEDERPWLDISVAHTREHLETFRASVKPGFTSADREFLKRVAQRFEFPFDPLALATPFDRPSLLLTGHQDSSVGFEDLVSLLPSFPRATLAVLDRAGHGVAEEQRVLFGALVGDWLDRIELEGASNTPGGY
jgi:pimeloyl-ACP methyl ester carboxylesterase